MRDTFVIINTKVFMEPLYWRYDKTKKFPRKSTDPSMEKDNAWISKISLCERTDGQRTEANSKDTFARAGVQKERSHILEKIKKYQNLPE